MRILWLNANLLLPLDKGGKLRTWHVMRHLAKRHEITYLTFADPAELEACRAGMQQVCTDLVAVPRRQTSKGTLRFYASVAPRVFDPLPYAVGAYRSSAYRRAVQSLVDRGRFDRLVCDFLVPAVNLPRQLPCPSVLFTHNVEAEIWRRHAETAAGLVRRRLYRQQWRRMLRFEGTTVARFDRVLAVSDVDRQALQRLYGDRISAPISVVPTGVDTTYFSPTPEVSVRPRHLVFVGSMDWLPNEDAVLFFCRDILPRIRQAEPHVTLSIVGRAPTAAVQRLARDRDIEVTGRVDDVRPHLGQAAACIVPLRIGGGTRLKIFEAMAAGKAVVSTTIGAEGLPVEPGRHLLIGDDPDTFSRAVLLLLRNPTMRRTFEGAARTLVAERFDWTVVGDAFEHTLTDTRLRSSTARVVPSTTNRALNRS